MFNGKSNNIYSQSEQVKQPQKWQILFDDRKQYKKLFIKTVFNKYSWNLQMDVHNVNIVLPATTTMHIYLQ